MKHMLPFLYCVTFSLCCFAGEEYLKPEALSMPREQISMALTGGAIRIHSSRGCVSMREMSVTGVQRIALPPMRRVKWLEPNFGDNGRFNLSFREEDSGALIQDVQDESGDPLYYNQDRGKAYEKLGATRGGADGWSLVLISQDAVWQPNQYNRTV